jgi:hypothetical protein
MPSTIFWQLLFNYRQSATGRPAIQPGFSMFWLAIFTIQPFLLVLAG